MTRIIFPILILFLLQLPIQVLAQVVTLDELELTSGGQAYLDSVGRNIQTEVVYYDPTQPAPAFDTEQVPEKPTEDRDVSLSGDRLIPTLIMVGLLAAIGYVVWRYGAGISVSLRQQVQNPERMRQSQSTKGFSDLAEPTSLVTVLGTKDRQVALVLLARLALIQGIKASGLLLQRSWTARDALRRLTMTPENSVALRELVLASERVQFGNRTISEADFQYHVDQIGPMLNEGTT